MKVLRKIGGKLSDARGFSLIELLVVIAIIGILSSIVLASLNTARNKGGNAAIKSGLSNLRAQMELYYDSNSATYGSYTPASNCPSAAASGSGFQDQAAVNILESVRNASGNYATCRAGGTYWWAAAALKVNEGTNAYWCVDSLGNSIGRANINNNFTSCTS